MIQLISNKSVEYLVGNPQIDVRADIPFSELRCDFLSELSGLIREDKRIKQHADLATFSFWARKANLGRLKELYLDDKSRLGLGLAFHITPGNVPVNFAYSFAFSFLAGNSNIVKISSRDFAQIDIFCELMNQMLSRDKFAKLRESNIFVRYSPDDEITKSFTRIADAKLIWGSDQTIEQIKKLPSKVRSRDLFFSDRFSVCVIDADVLVASSSQEVFKLAQGFFNDTYLMDQNACSSPSLIFWLEKQEMNAEKAQEMFWHAVAEFAQGKYEIQTKSVVDKYTQMCLDSVNIPGIATSRETQLIYRVNLKELPADKKMYSGACGYFYEHKIQDLSQILPVLNSSCQTLTYFGDKCRSILKTILDAGVQGVDRIVPIGKALDIEPEWDGYEIIKNLTRVIAVL